MNFDYIYCENSSFLGISQGLNTLSNLLFVAVALYFWREPAIRNSRYGLLLIAFCSMLWHSSEATWALFLDIGAIFVWVILYAKDAAQATKRPLKFYLWWFLRGAALGIALAKIFEDDLPLHSIAFLPIVLAGVAFAIHDNFPKRLRLHWFGSASLILIAIALRESDLHLCQQVPLGTHAFWHSAMALATIAPILTLRYFNQKNSYK